MSEFQEKNNYDERRDDDETLRLRPDERRAEEDVSRDERSEAPFHVPRD